MADINAAFSVKDETGEINEYHFKNVAEQVYFSDGETLQSKFDNKEKLWEGSLYLTGNDVAKLSKPLDKCANGIVLIWSDYDPGMENRIGNNYNWVASFIPKTGSFINSGNFYCPVPIIDNHYQDDNIIVKSMYIENDRILGVKGDENICKDGRDAVLREIWEV